MADWTSVVFWRVEISPEVGDSFLTASSKVLGEEGALVESVFASVKLLLKGACVGLTALAGPAVLKFTSSCKRKRKMLKMSEKSTDFSVNEGGC